MVTVVSKRAGWRQLLAFWLGTLAFNLVVGWLIMWLIVQAFPGLHEELISMGTHFATAGPSRESLALAVLAGMVITLMTRMQHGTDDMPSKAAVASAW